LKVLHVIPSVSDRSGGPAEAIFPMCRSLQSKGIDVLLATTNAGIDLNGIDTSRPTDYKQVPTLFFPSQWGKSFKYSRPLSVWLDENVADFDLVHVHAVFNHACISAGRSCRKQQVPYVVRPLGTLDPWGMQQKRLMKRTFWHVSGKRMLSGASAVHYTTRAEKEAAEQSLKLNHGNVVPLGIDFELSDSILTENSTTNQPPHNPYVLVLSRLHPQKGLEILIDAFVEVTRQEQFNHWRLVIAGDGPEEHVKVLKKQAAVSSGNRVLFPGWLGGEDKKLFLRRASLLALPSYRESFGLCVLEALTCGVPVIVGPGVNLSEAVAAAGAGWISDLDRKALAVILEQVLSSESERKLRGQAGKAMAARFAWPQVADELVAMYSKVLAEK